MTVREARVLYSHRRGLLVRAGKSFDGLEELLRDLATRDHAALLTIASFSGASEVYVAFLDAEGEAIGCVRVEKGTRRMPT